MVQVLARRSKNNPILLGDPGVGKTAIAEGLARAIVTGRGPPAPSASPPEAHHCVTLAGLEVRSAEGSPVVPRTAVALPEHRRDAQGRCRTARRCPPSSRASA